MTVVDEHLPVLREFVAAVRYRDADVISACLHYTPPGTLAQIAAEWIAVLLDEAEERDAELARLRQSERAVPGGDLMTAYRIAHQKRKALEAKLADRDRELAEARAKLAELMKLRREAA